MRADAEQPGQFFTTIARGEGVILPGAYATTPDDGNYEYVTQAAAPSQGGGSLAALMAGSKWNGVDAASQKTVITFSFADPAASVYRYTDGAEFQASLSAFSDADKATTRLVLSNIAKVCNVEFVEVPDNANECGVLRYGYSQQPNEMNFAGYAFFPSSSAIGGDIWIGSNMAGAEWNFYKPDLILHETLHAIGLKHPFESGVVLDASQNIIPNTVMSYSPVAGATSGYMSKYPAEPMAMDIAALQYLYGANKATGASNTVYDLAGADFQTGFRSVWDASGIDTFDAGHVARAVQIDLAEGALSNVGAVVKASGKVNGTTVYTDYTSTLTIASDTTIENAVGSAFGDSLKGNQAANWLQGGAGNDTLEGRGGDDLLDGGAGRDVAVYAGARAGYSVVGGMGTVTVSGGDTGTDTLAGIERLSFADCKVALDLDGNAGTVAKLLGAVFGAGPVYDPATIGSWLRLVDNGLGAQELAQSALDSRLGTGASNEQVVDLLYTHVVGHAPDAATQGYYVGLLENGSYTQASIAQMASETWLNAANIDLVGLGLRGLDYTG